ncbi:AraC family transcriptional regulator [Paenibacillus sp. 598K]|uniref:AraC family transcriptional regulator n=1 Tax=Paenibacillus sp. 598K TaxID=1117987 RepID=UPI000FF9B97A|nr:helix-turn-helix domain-containing protein [Paenibacillus sp. 598K]GBF75166.1 AraC family transcriptional regulator [Paenibacillus sp. 598K]
MPANDRSLPHRLTSREFMQELPFRLFISPLAQRLEVHWHEFFELGFVTMGEGKHVINGHSLSARKGMLFLLTPADFHEMIPAPGTTLVHYNLIFSDKLLDKELYRLLFAQYRKHLVCQLSEEDYGAIAAEFERIHREQEQIAALEAGRIVKGAIERLLIELMRRSGLPEGAGPLEQASDQHEIGATIAFLRLHFREPLTLEAAAREAGLSPNYFSTRFRQYTGVTYQHFLQNLRLQFAGSLLQTSTLPITEICFASGFRTLPHFERAFKQRYGVPPSKYRS